MKQEYQSLNNIKMKESIKKQETQIFYEWCYSKFEVRTKLELKGRGITKSEQTEGLYYATEKALEKLKSQYKCAPNIDYSI